MALNIWEVMLRGSALTTRVKSARKMQGTTSSVTREQKGKFDCDAELDLPAMLMLAGVALRDAGVRVRLLLLGVTPREEKRNYNEIVCDTDIANYQLICKKLYFSFCEARPHLQLCCSVKPDRFK